VSVVDRLARAVDELHPGRRVLIALDGPDASGKTTLAQTIQTRVRRPLLSASIDRWHSPREVRLRRGSESPEGYYRDSFDYLALTQRLLEPFRRGATKVSVGCFDYRSDHADQKTATVQPTTALLFDGVFLLRPELSAFWDLTVYLHVPESVTLTRAIARDSNPLGGSDHVHRRYQRRYLPGQAMYRALASPCNRADIVIDNSRPDDPVVLRWSTGH
jgi:uridine kinase